MNPAEAALLIAAVLVTAWYVDVRWHPWRKCPACGGTRKNKGSDSRTWGDCGRCGKTGQVRRWGARGER